MDKPARYFGGNIKLARISRGFSQTQLARLLSVSQPAVSQWEDDIKTPSQALRERIAAELDFPLSFFSLEIPHFGPSVGEVFHRRRRISETSKARYYAWTSIKAYAISEMLNPIDWPKVVISAFDVVDESTPVEAARMTRALLGVQMGPIGSMSDLLATSGVLIVPEYNVPDSMDGMSVWRNGAPPMIFINANMPIDRMRFTLAHELGHLVLHHQSEIYDLSTAIEDQANTFASEFLMPATEIRSQLRRMDHRSLSLLKRKWKVSRAALVMRAKSLGMMSGEEATQVWRDMSRRGWMKYEPDPIDPQIEEYDRSIREILNLNEQLGRLNEEVAQRLFGLHSATLRAQLLAPGAENQRSLLRVVQ